MSTDVTSHGHADAAGIPTSGSKTSATTPEPREINTVVDRGSRPILMSVFQPAWQTAANSTARKTALATQTFAAAGAHNLGPARRYWRGRATSAPSAFAACQPQCGSSRKQRAIDTISALPSAT